MSVLARAHENSPCKFPANEKNNSYQTGSLDAIHVPFLIITSRQRRVYLSDNPSLTINNFPIEQVSSTKSLGVSIDENLSWNTHIETVCKKIPSTLGLIKRIRDFVPFYTVLNIFNGLVKPQFDYCSLVWDCCSTGLAEKLQKLQNPVRLVYCCPPLMILVLQTCSVDFIGRI